MRDKFELACKIIGLIFFCIGAVYALSTIPMFFQKAPDVSQLYPDLSQVLNQSEINDMQKSASYIWGYALRTIIFFGIIPMLLGFYLMKSNNLFVKLCYPFEKRNIPVMQTPDIQLDVKPKESQEKVEKPSENKYAPPGYFQK